ncbi:alpha/beta-hydrolase [Aulographum hederae CBS 113979]|uniref:Carboxylic ester hydrolase n=1 Tax=Aulographum hederae CBS 113979 TaxID=1176131 RepID=A0A6G1H8K4_9PEZI|nr:alpha/beta-hydrolase [Aulographum hederae CBS 113979]
MLPFVKSLCFLSNILAAVEAASIHIAPRSPLAATVRTTSGNIVGHEAAWPTNSGISEYLGIPFATPPLGDLRFAAPKPFKENGTVQADTYGADCLQGEGLPASDPRTLDWLLAGGFSVKGYPRNKSEDCLTLNVWAKPQTGDKKKAVLIFLYGGAFMVGTTNAPAYNGARLAAEEDIIVVTPNYRLNLFGWSHGPAPLPQNVALLDQRLAVEWVRDNIAAFGGDPSRIILSGESAGAFSTDFYAYAWKEDPIVAGFIAQSGVASFPMPEFGNLTDPWFAVAGMVGCGGAEKGVETVECMRRVDSSELQRAVGNMSVGGGLLTPFLPVPDGKTIFADGPAKSKAGDFIKKPMILGENNNELNLLYAFAKLSPGPLLNGITSLASNAIFTCGIATTARDRVAGGVPAWRYRYMSTWNNTGLGPGIGAYHSSEIPLVFGTTEHKPFREAPARDEGEEGQVGRAMRGLWGAFVRDPVNGLVGKGWPVYKDQDLTLNRLGWENKAQLNLAKGNEYDAACPAT